MSTLSHQPAGQHNDDVHLPEPSYWPIALAMSIMLLPIGFLLTMWGSGGGGPMLLMLGGVCTVICMMGWANSVIKETAALPNIQEDDKWMRHGLKLFLISEAAIFGAFFAHHYYTRWHFPAWPPEGAPHIDTTLPAIATLILMSSSATMEFAHVSLVKGNRSRAKLFTFITIVLGVIFMAFQAHEYGFLKTYDNFTLQSGMFGSHFFAMTGFHGLHVATGIIMLAMVWFRLRLGHFDPKRHFSFVAASWYWHFVDLVWIFLFFTIYLI
ncbi:cytochrome c oxidase subunit 3 [candidate division KSB1 bacterium]|nr:cytochrome c oxidase subunit 3 [candidate division KSB1 bacterium]